MAELAPGGAPVVYITGICLILAGISMIIEKLDKLATVLLGIMLLLFIIPHIQMMSDNPNEMANILKNIAMAGGAFLYSSKYAKDKTFLS
ncbi:MAG: hypothetical protein HKN67_00665 [Saprospiraceae bacterium]|nr:hypothetical protein [Bacteroidia bacterium]NNF20425.1 hypothetical protein [Saprospiraceae bacterium]